MKNDIIVSLILIAVTWCANAIASPCQCVCHPYHPASNMECIGNLASDECDRDKLVELSETCVTKCNTRSPSCHGDFWLNQ